MLNEYSKYCTTTILGMIQYEFSTHENKVMNHSVATLAPKTKTLSESSPLLTRVFLCGATQILGHHEVWNHIFAKFYLTLDANLSHHSQRKDVVKSKRQLLQKTKEYKLSRSQNRYVKYVEAHVTQLEEMKTGVMYQTGVAVKAAKKSVKNQPCQEILKEHYSRTGSILITTNILISLLGIETTTLSSILCTGKQRIFVIRP